MKKGDKALARYITEMTLENVKIIQLKKYHKAESEEEKSRIQLNPRTIFSQAVENCKPLLILQKVVRGGVMYEVPVPVMPNYQTYKAFFWLIEAAKEKDRSARIWDSLARELIDASNNEGKAVRKKIELHRTCEANRAYAHYRW